MSYVVIVDDKSIWLGLTNEVHRVNLSLKSKSIFIYISHSFFNCKGMEGGCIIKCFLVPTRWSIRDLCTS